MNKYILYTRKSTDEEDRQVLSIEAQITELKEFALKEKLEIIASYSEAKTAKEPGRIKFGEMLELIEKGKANGILSWHPDRLARNPIDGGKIIYLVDTDKINNLKFPSFWFENTPQGKFMLNIAFGQSKYFIDNLSENVKRGIRQKLRRGEWPGYAPLGYINNLKNHTIALDKEKHKLVRKIFELYSTGEYPFAVIAEIINNLGLTSRSNTKMSCNSIQQILRNSFYCGVFSHKGEIYEGSHEPIISKKLFEKCKEVMENRGRPHRNKKHNFVFTGLIKCGICGCMVTAESKKGHIYYHCTKKKTKCGEKYLREENLVDQILNIFQKVSLPKIWIEKMLDKLESEKDLEKQSNSAIVQKLQNEVLEIGNKIDRLLDLKLDGIIESSEYLKKKENLVSQKLSINEKIKTIFGKGNNRLEPMKDFLLQNQNTEKIAKSGDFSQIRAFLKNIGSNFILKGNLLSFEPEKGWEVAALRAAHTKWQGW